MADEQAIIGGRELDALLQSLPVKVERNILRSALRAGAAVFRTEARQNVPVDEGDLRASIRVTTRTRRGTVYAAVKAGGSRAPHWHWIEFGTAAHKIRPKRQEALAFGRTVAREVDHPGGRPQPYMRPAFDSGQRAALAAIAAKIRERLTLQGINTPAPED